VPFVDVAKGRRVLPPDARMFQDYAAYVTRASSLWVWSLSGLSAQETWMDANRGNLIYERQVVVELLEYGYMLHRSLYHRASSFATTSEVVAVRKEILRLRLKMREASHSGEIRDLLESGWHELGLPDLITEIDAGLALRESETRSEEAQRSERVGWALTIVFGLVAVPTLADQIIKPIWKLMSLHQFTDPSWAAVVWNGVALVTVVVCLCTTLLVMSHRTK